MRPEIFGMIVVGFLFLLTVPFYSTGLIGGSGINTGQVKVTSSDNNIDYLFSKLQAGSNITLTVQNPGADENILISSTGAVGDTNCAISGSCPNVLYKNTDFNAEDINAQSLTLQQPGGQKFIYSTTTGKALEVPFPSTCTEVFGVAGLPQTGLEFCASPWTAIAYRILATPIFLFFEGGSNQGAFYQVPQSAPLSNPPILGAVTQWATYPDGNRFMCYHNQTIGWKECGTFQSQYSPNFRFQSGDFNNTSDKNQLRFLGPVDFNAPIDVNGNGAFNGRIDVNANGNFGGSINVDGNITMTPGKSITGFVYTFVAGNTISCNTICNAADGNSFGNLTCIDSILSTAGSHQLCSNNVGQRTCICQN